MEPVRRTRWYLHPGWIAAFVALAVLAATGVSIGAYAWKRQAALAWIERTHGDIMFEELPSWVPYRVRQHWPYWAHRVLSVTVESAGGDEPQHLSAFREAKSLSLYGSAATDTQLATLARFHRLESLSLRSPHITDAGMISLRQCRSLRHLDLYCSNRMDLNPAGTLVGDEGLKQLVGLPIEHLDLSHTLVTDAGIDSVKRFPRLLSLSLAGTGVTDDGLAALGAMSDLESFNASDTGIGDPGLAVLATWPKLATLAVARTGITDAGLVHLSTLPLSDLDLSDTDITDAGFQHLPVRPGWKELNLSGTCISTDAAQRFATALKLKVIHWESDVFWERDFSPHLSLTSDHTKGIGMGGVGGPSLMGGMGLF